MSRKENALDLAKFVDKAVRVKLSGGREAPSVACSKPSIQASNCRHAVEGVLKGYDPLLNLVLDETKEFLRDPDDPLRVTDDTRFLGLIVCRGTAVMLVAPSGGMEEIANPFMEQG